MSTTTTHTADVHAHVPHIGVKTLLTIYVALLGLMLLTFGMAYVDMGFANFPVAMGIATAKMVLIIIYFMHVRYSDTLTKIFSFAIYIWLLVMVGGFLNDYFTRGLLNVPGK